MPPGVFSVEVAPSGLGAALVAGFGAFVAVVATFAAPIAPGLLSNVPSPGRSGDDEDAGAVLVFGEEPGDEGAGGFGFAVEAGAVAERGDDFVSGRGRGRPSFEPGPGGLPVAAGAAGGVGFGSLPPLSLIGRGAFGMSERASV